MLFSEVDNRWSFFTKFSVNQLTSSNSSIFRSSIICVYFSVSFCFSLLFLSLFRKPASTAIYWVKWTFLQILVLLVRGGLTLGVFFYFFFRSLTGRDSNELSLTPTPKVALDQSGTRWVTCMEGGKVLGQGAWEFLWEPAKLSLRTNWVVLDRNHSEKIVRL